MTYYYFLICLLAMSVTEEETRMNDLPTEFDCASILQMMQETPDAAEAIIAMIADLEELDESCLHTIREMQQARGPEAA